jgi:hypothetical protein
LEVVSAKENTQNKNLFPLTNVYFLTREFPSKLAVSQFYKAILIKENILATSSDSFLKKRDCSVGYNTIGQSVSLPLNGNEFLIAGNGKSFLFALPYVLFSGFIGIVFIILLQLINIEKKISKRVLKFV